MTLKREYSRLKSLLQAKATEIHDLTIMQMLETMENAELATETSITDLITEMEGEADELPDEGSHDFDPEPEGKEIGPLEEIDSSEPDPLTADGGEYER
jgi:hypothetical protein